MRTDPPADWFPNLYLSSENREIGGARRSWIVPNDFWEHPERYVYYLKALREEMWRLSAPVVEHEE